MWTAEPLDCNLRWAFWMGVLRPMRAFLRRSREIVVLVALVLGAPAFASAQDANSAAAAEALFREGRQLMDQGRYGDACPKFQASYELDVALGTLLNLANCYQLAGQLASAWARFVEAETMARRASDSRGQVARERAAALEPRLVRVRVIVRNPIEGLRVEVGGREFARALWGSAIPIDAGEITLVASAPRYESHTQTFRAVQEGTTIDVEVPALVAAPVDDAPPNDPASPRIAITPQRAESGPHTRPLGYALGGVGVVAAGVGLGLGASARALWDSDACPPDAGGVRTCRTAAAQADAEDARVRANLSTAFVAAGGALLVTGVILIAVGRGGDDELDERAQRIVVVPVADANGAGLVVGGSF